MDPSRFQTLTQRYPGLRIAVLGDFCLDRYLEIDPDRKEVSIETGLPVHNVVNVRAQPGGAGTILNNLSALGIGTIYPIGFVGEDGEGFELWTALGKVRGVKLDGMIRTPARRTFTYCKPLVLSKGKPPLELNRLDSKNWSPTPAPVQQEILNRVVRLKGSVDAVIVLEQVDVPETGVVTRHLSAGLAQISEELPRLWILADSRRGLKDFPPVVFKMNAAELGRLSGADRVLGLGQVKAAAAALARKNDRLVFVTLAEEGIVGAAPDGQVEHVPVFPVRGEIDIVGAGDAVSGNLAAALSAGAGLREALEFANAAASVVIHQLGTTGTASVAQLKELLIPR